MVVPEENVLGLANDPFAGKSMVVSELCPGAPPGDGPASGRPRLREAAAEAAIRAAGEAPGHRRSTSSFRSSTTRRWARRLWTGTAAARDRAEYWAAGVEAYFDAAGAGTAADRRRPAHHHPRGAESLRSGAVRPGRRDDGLSGARRLAVRAREALMRRRRSHLALVIRIKIRTSRGSRHSDVTADRHHHRGFPDVDRRTRVSLALRSKTA